MKKIWDNFVQHKIEFSVALSIISVIFFLIAIICRPLLLFVPLSFVLLYMKAAEDEKIEQIRSTQMKQEYWAYAGKKIAEIFSENAASWKLPKINNLSEMAPQSESFIFQKGQAWALRYVVPICGEVNTKAVKNVLNRHFSPEFFVVELKKSQMESECIEILVVFPVSPDNVRAINSCLQQQRQIQKPPAMNDRDF